MLVHFAQFIHDYNEATNVKVLPNIYKYCTPSDPYYLSLT